MAAIQTEGRIRSYLIPADHVGDHDLGWWGATTLPNSFSHGGRRGRAIVGIHGACYPWRLLNDELSAAGQGPARSQGDWLFVLVSGYLCRRLLGLACRASPRKDCNRHFADCGGGVSVLWHGPRLEGRLLCYAEGFRVYDSLAIRGTGEHIMTWCPPISEEKLRPKTCRRVCAADVDVDSVHTSLAR